ncbi:hypothetical protein, partial [Streptococcus sobrinus]|uniref:hypothetical protein n=1 Tax=Streptococcus sobrinus TaxID=1310 RepID=UPI00067BFEEE
SKSIMTDLLIFEEYKFCSNGSKKSPRPHKDESSWYHLNSEELEFPVLLSDDDKGVTLLA